MKIYVASSWRNKYQQEAVKSLKNKGYEVYDFKETGDGWGNPEGPAGFSWSEIDEDWKNWPSNTNRYIEGLNHPRAVEGFDRDMNAILACDLLVMVQPCGPSAAAELGFACGFGIPTIVYLPEIREPDLMLKMANKLTNSWKEVLAYIEKFV